MSAAAVDVTHAFWAFLSSLGNIDGSRGTPVEEEGPLEATLESSAYRELCKAARSGCPLLLRGPSGGPPTALFPDIVALLETPAHELARLDGFGPVEAGTLATSVARIRAWVDVNYCLADRLSLQSVVDDDE